MISFWNVLLVLVVVWLAVGCVLVIVAEKTVEGRPPAHVVFLAVVVVILISPAVMIYTLLTGRR